MGLWKWWDSKEVGVGRNPSLLSSRVFSFLFNRKHLYCSVLMAAVTPQSELPTEGWACRYWTDQLAAPCLWAQVSCRLLSVCRFSRAAEHCCAWLRCRPVFFLLVTLLLNKCLTFLSTPFCFPNSEFLNCACIATWWFNLLGAAYVSDSPLYSPTKDKMAFSFLKALLLMRIIGC